MSSPDGGRDVRSNLVRFIAVVIAIDALGIGLWGLFPPGTSIRTAILFGTLVAAPFVGFLVVYVPAAASLSDRQQ